ncbi:hypothetical protein HY971_04880 [Candidatus Kaiserbacteria bacterium]|nr:hypothetical protein [Candidatus Kaiserbacteria bacterium]
MTIDALIMLGGAFVAVLPFLGFPNSWDTFFFFCAGVFIIALGIVVRRRLARRVTAEGLGRSSGAPKHEEISVRDVPPHEDTLAQ